MTSVSDYPAGEKAHDPSRPDQGGEETELPVG
jgi:hypothetical protein